MHYTLIQRFWWFIYWLALVVSFCLIGFILVAQATGYRYNRQVSRWQKTGMIVVSAEPNDSNLYLENTRYELSLSSRIPNILPGSYRIEVRHVKYMPWESSVTILPGYVASFEPIILFLKEPINLEPRAEHYEKLEKPRVDDEVRIVDGELWLANRLVSRFVDPPTAAILLSTGRHIVYSQGNHIRVIEANGSHDQLLYARSSFELTALRLEGDRSIIFNDGNEIKVLQIR